MEYKTVDISTVAGQATVDRMVRAGWMVYRPGMFTVVLRRRDRFARPRMTPPLKSELPRPFLCTNP